MTLTCTVHISYGLAVIKKKKKNPYISKLHFALCLNSVHIGLSMLSVFSYILLHFHTAKCETLVLVTMPIPCTVCLVTDLHQLNNK